MIGFSGLQALEVVNDLTDEVEINLFEGPEGLINFAFPVKFDEHLSRSRPGCRLREDLISSGL
jgi:hypothetical protein